MHFPEDLLYTKDHEWVRINGDIATIGITDFAQSELGDIVYVEIETLGEELNEHDIFGSVEAVKTVSDLFMPLAGSVVEINQDLSRTPEVINQDPYGKGWMVKVRFSDAGQDNMNAAEYRKMVGK